MHLLHSTKNNQLPNLASNAPAKANNPSFFAAIPPTKASQSVFGHFVGCGIEIAVALAFIEFDITQQFLHNRFVLIYAFQIGDHSQLNIAFASSWKVL